MFQKKFQNILTLGPFGPFGFRLTRSGTTSSAAWPFGCGLFSPGRRGKLATGAARGAEWCLRGLHVPGTGSEGGSWVKRTLKTWKTVNTVDVTAVEIIYSFIDKSRISNGMEAFSSQKQHKDIRTTRACEGPIERTCRSIRRG